MVPVSLPGSRSRPYARAHGPAGRLTVSRGVARMMAVAAVMSKTWSPKTNHWAGLAGGRAGGAGQA
jgi:hypothetical protein